MGIIWDSVTGGFVALDDLLRFSLDEPVNYDERVAWWSELTPFYGPGWGNIVSFDQHIGIAQFCGVIPSYVTPAPLTVEADGDVAITCDLPHYPWQRFGGTSRWDNLFADLSYWRWYLVRHGTLSHVSPCEVTL